jgi:hypothetical protein
MFGAGSRGAGYPLVASSVFVGVLASRALTRVLQAQLGDTSPYDPPAYLAARALLVTRALVAILIPGCVRYGLALRGLCGTNRNQPGS